MHFKTNLSLDKKMIEQESSPFFSIIIPVYNTSNTVNRTVLSVINQSFSNIEVIIVDDC